MRIIVAAAVVFVNFILQSTLFHYLEIGGIFPNTALILAISYSLLRGSREGCIFGAVQGLLFDIFFGRTMGLYTLLFFIAGLLAGRSQKSFYRENYLLPMVVCTATAGIFEGIQYFIEFIMRGDGYFLFFISRILLPTMVYTAVVSLIVYRVLFGINEWLEVKEKYKYRLF